MTSTVPSARVVTSTASCASGGTEAWPKPVELAPAVRGVNQTCAAIGSPCFTPPESENETGDDTGIGRFQEKRHLPGLIQPMTPPDVTQSHKLGDP